MSQTERIIGDPKGITRRSYIKGAVTVIAAALLTSGIGAFAITTYDRAKAYITNRIGGLYNQDAGMTLRVSHKNPEIITLYKEYLSPGQVLPAKTELSHRLLHTVYGDDVATHIAELKSVSLEHAVEETAELMAKLNDTSLSDEASAHEDASQPENSEPKTA